ncbi:MAG TPA: serine hydrolase domain-containing protein [Ktedonobacteraceae bacterium]|nr:serine hydrolase domain-containing protein [Ktedonobacteraceae bacterium]
MINKKELALVFEQLEQEHKFSGTMLVSQDGEVLFEKAYGYASRQLNVPNVLATKYHIASVTKMFIAMAALILSEQGRIGLHEKPAAYLPELAALDQDITLHHLLSHTSGLQDIYDVPNLRFEMHKLKNEQGNLLSYLVKLPQLFRPGEGWSYSSTGYILMGYLMEKVTGLSFPELMNRSILTPLSMTNTGLDLPRRINAGRACGHAVENGQLVNADNDRLSIFEEAPGELYSTVQDLKIWCDALFDCPIVAPQTLKLMFTPYGQVTPSLQYGYGCFLAPRFRIHGGGTPGFQSRIKQYPEQKVSIILLFNSDHMSMEPILTALEPLIIG